MRKIIMLGLLLGVLSLGACAFHDAMKGPYKEDAVNTAFVDYMVDKAEDRLSLTPEQRLQLEEAVLKMVRQGLAQQPQVKALRRQMADVVRQERLDVAALEALMEARMELMRTAMEQGKADLVALHATLSQEQRENLAMQVEAGKRRWMSPHEAARS